MLSLSYYTIVQENSVLVAVVVIASASVVLLVCLGPVRNSTPDIPAPSIPLTTTSEPGDVDEVHSDSRSSKAKRPKERRKRAKDKDKPANRATLVPINTAHTHRSSPEPLSDAGSGITSSSVQPHVPLRGAPGDTIDVSLQDTASTGQDTRGGSPSPSEATTATNTTSFTVQSSTLVLTPPIHQSPLPLPLSADLVVELTPSVNHVSEDLEPGRSPTFRSVSINHSPQMRSKPIERDLTPEQTHESRSADDWNPMDRNPGEKSSRVSARAQLPPQPPSPPPPPSLGLGSAKSNKNKKGKDRQRSPNPSAERSDQVRAVDTIPEVGEHAPPKSLPNMSSSKKSLLHTENTTKGTRGSSPHKTRETPLQLPPRHRKQQQALNSESLLLSDHAQRVPSPAMPGGYMMGDLPSQDRRPSGSIPQYPLMPSPYQGYANHATPYFYPQAVPGYHYPTPFAYLPPLDYFPNSVPLPQQRTQPDSVGHVSSSKHVSRPATPPLSSSDTEPNWQTTEDYQPSFPSLNDTPPESSTSFLLDNTTPEDRNLAAHPSSAELSSVASDGGHEIDFPTLSPFSEQSGDVFQSNGQTARPLPLHRPVAATFLQSTLPPSPLSIGFGHDAHAYKPSSVSSSPRMNPPHMLTNLMDDEMRDDQMTTFAQIQQGMGGRVLRKSRSRSSTASGSSSSYGPSPVRSARSGDRSSPVPNQRGHLGPQVLPRLRTTSGNHLTATPQPLPARSAPSPSPMGPFSPTSPHSASNMYSPQGYHTHYTHSPIESPHAPSPYGYPVVPQIPPAYMNALIANGHFVHGQGVPYNPGYGNFADPNGMMNGGRDSPRRPASRATSSGFGSASSRAGSPFVTNHPLPPGGMPMLHHPHGILPPPPPMAYGFTGQSPAQSPINGYGVYAQTFHPPPQPSPRHHLLMNNQQQPRPLSGTFDAKNMQRGNFSGDEDEAPLKVSEHLMEAIFKNPGTISLTGGSSRSGISRSSSETSSTARSEETEETKGINISNKTTEQPHTKAAIGDDLVRLNDDDGTTPRIGEASESILP